MYDSESSALHSGEYFVNPLPDDKILDWSKLKQIADDILTLYSIDTHFDTSTMEVFEKIVGKGKKYS